MICELGFTHNLDCTQASLVTSAVFSHLPAHVSCCLRRSAVICELITRLGLSLVSPQRLSFIKWVMAAPCCDVLNLFSLTYCSSRLIHVCLNQGRLCNITFSRDVTSNELKITFSYCSMYYKGIDFFLHKINQKFLPNSQSFSPFLFYKHSFPVPGMFNGPGFMNCPDPQSAS